MYLDNQYQITVILLSFNDSRVLTAIASVLRFDDLGCARLVVVDGGSRPDLVLNIKGVVRAQDIVVSEKDSGIFDALNKGLAMVSTEFIAWLGADDFFAPNFRASYLLPKLKQTDILIANTAHFAGRAVTRVSYSWPIRFGLNRCGLNNPHFSTFGRSSYLKRVLFNTDSPVADIEYFLKVFALRPRVATVSLVSTYMAEGGFSNRTWGAFVRNTRRCYLLYFDYFGIVVATVSIPLRLFYKVGSRWIHAIRAALRLRLSQVPHVGLAMSHVRDKT